MSVTGHAFPERLGYKYDTGWEGGKGVHVRVVFIFPTLTRRDTIATLMAKSKSIINFSRTTLEHLLLRDMDSIYNSANVIFGAVAL
jgi:hypothetical protein